MFLYLRNQRKSAPFYSDGFFIGAAGLQSTSYVKNTSKIRKRGIQKNIVAGSSLPLYFLLNSLTNSSLQSTHCRITFILPHSSPISPLDGSFRIQNSTHCLRPITCSLYCLINFSRSFSGNVDSGGSDSDFGSDGENQTVDDSVKWNKEDVERVYRLVYKTFPCEGMMEVILDLCQLKLSHELVLAVLDRFKLAWRPAFRFFCWANKQPGFAHDSRTYNRMMRTFGQTRQFETMLSILEEMGEKGLFTIQTFIICIRSFAAAKESKKAIWIFDLMEKYKFEVDIETVNSLLDALGRAKLGKEAHSLFENLKDRFAPNLRTYTILLNGWCKLKNLTEAEWTWNEMINNGLTPDIVAYNTVLGGLLRSSRRFDAIQLFREMKSKGPIPNAHSYTILIAYLCKNCRTREAIGFLDDMIDSGCKPDVPVYNCLMIGFGNIKKLDVVYQIMNDMMEQGCQPDVRTYNIMIKMMVKRKMPEDAVKVYKKLLDSNIQPTIHTYNMMMKSYFVAKDCEMACRVWEEMKINGCCPDEIAYSVIILGLIRQGKSMEACKYFVELIEKGMRGSPQFDYRKVRAEFLRAGKLDIWEQLAQKMKLKLEVQLPQD